MAVPKAMRDIYEEIAPLICEFCDDHLDEAYKVICLRLLEKLCRKRPSPLLHGRHNTWAAGIVYAIATLNFIFDRENPHYMPADAIAAEFDLAAGTVGNKAADIRRLINLSPMDSDWMIPAYLVNNPLVWMVSVNGFLVDVRDMPKEVQRIAFDKGLIPFLPDLEMEPSETL